MAITMAILGPSFDQGDKAGDDDDDDRGLSLSWFLLPYPNPNPNISCPFEKKERRRLR